MSKYEEISLSQINVEDVVLIGAGVAVVGGAIVIGSQVAAGVFTGAITAAGVGYTVFKLRKHAPRVFNVIHDRPLTSDIILDAGVFLIVGGTTVTGIVAGASASLFTSIALNGIRRLGKVDVKPINLFDRFKGKESAEKIANSKIHL